jgi:Glycosyl transferase family 11
MTSARPIIVLAQSHGRLGNRLWTLANLLAYAIEKRLTLLAPPSSQIKSPAVLREGWPGKLALLGYRLNLKLSFFPTLLLKEGELLDLEHDPDFEGLARSRYVLFLSGFYFAAPASLQLHRQQIVTTLAPPAEVLDSVRRVMGQCGQRADVQVGVHMRRTDYRVFCDGLLFYTDAEFYAVMQHLAERFRPQTACFHLVSDEPIDPAAFDGLNIEIHRGAPLEDMYSLASCDYIIGPNSSFSHWASFWGAVPLHILDWKTMDRFCPNDAVHYPDPDRHFRVFEAADFGKHSLGRVSVRELLQRSVA